MTMPEGATGSMPNWRMTGRSIGRDDERDDRRLHEHAAYREQYDYAPEQDYAAVGEADERLRENRGQLVVDDSVAEYAGEGENHRDDGEVLDAVDYADLELVPRELLIDEGSDGEGVEDSERAGPPTGVMMPKRMSAISMNGKSSAQMLSQHALSITLSG